MITFEPITDEAYWQKIYLEAFPERERSPYEMLVELSETKPVVALHTIAEDGKAIGLVVWVELGDDKAFILYFAIDQSLRGGGYGGKVLTALKERFTNGIILEAEFQEPDADNLEQRERRHRFYEKNGVVDSTFASKAFGGIYHLMRSNVNITVEDYLKGVQILSDYPTMVAPASQALRAFN